MKGRGARARGALLATCLGLGAAGCGPGPPRAIVSAQQRITAAPKDPAAWVALATALDEEGREEEALDAFETAFDLQSKDLAAYRRAAAIAGSFGRYVEARLFADLGLFDHPGDPECLLLAARALVSRGKHQKAREYLKKLGHEQAAPFVVSRDKAMLAKLRYKHDGPVFVIRTDTSAAMAAQVSQTAERIFARYRDLIPGLRAPGYKMRIFLFNEKADYAAMVQRYHGHLAETEGLTVRDPFGIRVIACIESEETFEGVLRGPEWINRILLHEINHVGMFLTAGNVPPWVAEGFAEYTAGAEPVNSSFEVGGVLRGRADMMRFLEAKGLRFPSLGSLLGSRDGSLGQGVPPVAFYSYAWSLVHFLHQGQGGAYRERFQRMLELLVAGRKGDAFSEAFAGVDLGQLETRWQAHARGL